jgi:hypothetical protein
VSELEREVMPCEGCGEADARFIGRSDYSPVSGWLCLDCEAELFVFTEDEPA